MRYFKKKIAAILVACLAVGAIPYAVALARGYIEVDRECAITVKVPATWEDIKNAEFDVELYRVASVDQNDVYTALDSYGVIAERLSAISHETTADDWSKMAEDVRAVVEAGTVASDYTIHMQNGIGVATGVRTGLYLVYAKDAKTVGYGYSFTPYLVSAPNNEYATTGEGSDDWIYDDIILELKAEQYELLGDLEIVKSLKTYNTTLGTPLFVFDVEATDDEGKVVFSDVISISFDSAGVGKAIVKDIPAGAHVTVTEVYSGASYETVSSPEQTIEIVAEDMVSVDFSNDYNDKLVFGTGVVNHFEYDGQGWTWHQVTDNK